MNSSTETLIETLRILSRDIQSEDGVANAAIAEAAERMDQLNKLNAALQRSAAARLKWFAYLSRDTTAQQKANRIKKRKLRALRAALRALRPATPLTRCADTVTLSVTQGQP